jgi:DNA-binding IclR family transcriptional regulator
VAYAVSLSATGETSDYRSLRRAVLLLDQFSPDRQTLGASDLARATGLNKATVHRLAQALAALGLLEQDEETRRYRLGLRMLEFAVTVQAGLDIHERARPVLARLTEACGETTYLLVRRDHSAVCVARNQGIHLLRDLTTEVGTVLPLNVGAASIAMLAHLPADERDEFLAARVPSAERAALEAELSEVRERGCSAVMNAVADGQGGLAAPIYDRDGTVCAALSIAGVAGRLEDNVDTLAPLTIEGAAEITRLIGGQAPARASEAAGTT